MTSILDPATLLQWLGAYVFVGIFLMISLESVVFGVVQPVPGDAVLFTAGLLTTTRAIDAELWVMCVVVTSSCRSRAR